MTSHRRLLRIAALALLLFGGGLVAIFRYQPMGDIEDHQFLMDTVVSIKIYQSRDENLLQSAFARIASLEAELSRYHPQSEISKINNLPAGSPIKISRNAAQVLDIALDYAKLSGGAFDPTIGPLVDIWGIGGENPRIPGNPEIAKLLPLVNYEAVHLNLEERSIAIEQEGMRLDIGGIAKGWIADEIAVLLYRNGAKHVLINLGGNVRIMGGKPGGKPFRIGMQDPFGERGSYMGIFTLSEGSIVSSGIYERYFEENGIQYHHILDTETGYPVDHDLAAVTVISPYSVDGDALSTALFAMGLESGLKMVQSLSGIEAAFITADGNIVITPDAATIFEPRKKNLPLIIL